MSAVLALMPVNEERRKVRLRDHGDHPVVSDLDVLEDQPRQIVPLLRSRCIPRRRQISKVCRCPDQHRCPLGRATQPIEFTLEIITFDLVCLPRPITPRIEFFESLQPAFNIPAASPNVVTLPSRRFVECGDVRDGLLGQVKGPEIGSDLFLDA
jgi:hypothetical protein